MDMSFDIREIEALMQLFDASPEGKAFVAAQDAKDDDDKS